MSDKNTPTPDGQLISVLYALIIYHNCFRQHDHISWLWLLWIPLLYFICFLPFALLYLFAKEWMKKK
jgi:hypothetical protein